MSIATEMTNLATNRDAIKAAIEAKNPVTAPTSSLSSFPAAIASIPSGGDWKWQKPPDWPDIKSALQTYPTGATAAESNALAIMFDLMSVAQVSIKCGTSYRWSDAPETVETATNKTTTVSHTFPSGAKYGWVIAYASDSVYVSGNQNVDTLISGTTNNKSTYPVKWIVGRGVAEARVSNMRGVVAVENGTTSFITPVAYCQSAYPMQEFVFSSHAGFSAATSLQAFCSECYALRVVSADKIKTTNVNNLASAFSSCYNLDRLDTSGWDVSSVTNFSSLFFNCYSLKQIDVSDWDVSEGTNFSNMFSNCFALTSLDVSAWDTSSCTLANAMFNGCRSLAEIDVSSWDTSSFTNTYSMFNGCSSLTTIDISGWNLAAVTTALGMFDSCVILESLIGDKTVSGDGSINGSTSYFGKGLKVGFKVNASDLLTHDSLLFLMYWLGDLGSGSATLNVGNTNLAKLSASEIAVATAKGWSITA